MKRFSFILAFLVPFIGNTQNPTQWTSGWAPYFRHVNAVEILPNNKFIAVGGWEFNDAITSIFTSVDSANTWNLEMDAVNAILQDVHFPNSATGYTVGWAGNIWKSSDSGDNWNQINVPGTPGTRNFNACHFFDANTGIVVGGNKSNDAIRTILKTTDGGSNWSVIADNLNPWLNAVHFGSSTTGYAVGDGGSILKSTDSGDNWTEITLTGGIASRQYNDVYFFDANVGVAVGGWLSNDSISTIIRTTDGGNNWSVISDNLGSMLNSVHFYNAQEGYAVGNDGLIWYSNDAGQTWSNQTTLISNNDQAYGNRDVYFQNAYFGLVGGSNGKILVYHDTNAGLATGELASPVVITSANSVLIEGSVNDENLVTSLELEYGNTMAFGSSEPINPASTNGNGLQNISVELNGLAIEEVYFARMKMTNALGVTYSNVISFYTGISTVPNFSFELWDEYQFDVLDDWYNNGQITQVTSHDGSYAVNLSQDPSGELGAILMGIPGQNGLTGGIPYTERPDSLTFWANYNIAPNDSALVLLQLKENNTPIADTIYKIGGSSAGWEYFSFGIDYFSGLNPDSIVIAFTNTNIFGGFNEPTSTISIDNVILKGATQQIPNGDMESWSVSSRLKATSWISDDDQNSQTPYVIGRTTDAYAGDYAVTLKNYIGQGNSHYSRMNTGDNLNNWEPSFQVNNNHDTLFGYYKFSPENGDSLFIRVAMFENGSQIGWGEWTASQNVPNYLRFHVPIQYWTGNADSCLIEVSIYNASSSNPGQNTMAWIDNLSFDAIVSPVLEIAENELDKKEWVNIYPNPTNGPTTIEFSNESQSPVKCLLVDLNGKLLKEINEKTNNQKINFDISEFHSGQYFIIVVKDENIYSFKTIRQ